MKDWWKK